MRKQVAYIAYCCFIGLITFALPACDCCDCSNPCPCDETTVKNNCGCISSQQIEAVTTQKKTEVIEQQQQMKEEKPMAKEKSASGLEWEILQPGSGESPSKGKTVVVHYTGWLNDNGQPGKKFDSSVDRGQKFKFPIGLGMVIKGWDEGVMGMKVGEKRRLYIPADLGYGAHGAGGGIIPPNAALIFDVELFEIQ